MFQIDYSSRVPIYEQICNSVIKLASAGVLKPHDKIPPVRVLADQLGINPNTVAKSYRDLEMRGYIYSAVGRGSFVTDKLSKDNALKILAVDEFTKAASQAIIYGVSRDELIEIIDSIEKGGSDNDSD